MSENDPDISSRNDKALNDSSCDDAALRTNDASYLLFYFYKSRQCRSLRDALFSLKTRKNAVYAKEMAEDPALLRLQYVLPDSTIVKNIQDYCHKELELLDAEEKLADKEAILRKVRTQAGRSMTQAYMDPDSSSVDNELKLSKWVLLIGLIATVLFLIAVRPISGSEILLAVILAGMFFLSSVCMRAYARANARKNRERLHFERERADDIADLKADVETLREKISMLQVEQGDLLKKIQEEFTEICGGNPGS